MGTPDFAVPSLERMAGSRHDLVAVVTQPDRPRGRGRKLAPPEVKRTAQGLGIPVLQPTSLTDPAFLGHLEDLGADLFAVVAFSILPRRVLKIPRLGSVNLHPSLLPRYRGAAPIQWAVICGETETGVSIFRLSSRVDAGDLLLQERVSIGPDETAGELYERLKVLGADMLVRAVDGLADGTVAPVPQTDVGATRAPRLEKEDGRLDWSRDAETLRNRIRGTNPFPGAFTFWQGQVLKVHRAAVVDGDGAPGTVLQADPRAGVWVAAGSGALALEEGQPAGKKRMKGVAFVRGYPVAVGEVLGMKNEK